MTDPIEKVLVNVQYTANWLQQLSAETLQPYGISIQQYNVLRILRGQHPKSATVKLLIERMIDKSSNASRLVDKLVAKQLVDRTTCPNDRRRVDIIINEKGLGVLEEITQKMKASYVGNMGLSTEEAEQLSDLLDKLRA